MSLNQKLSYILQGKGMVYPKEGKNRVFVAFALLSNNWINLEVEHFRTNAIRQIDICRLVISTGKSWTHWASHPGGLCSIGGRPWDQFGQDKPGDNLIKLCSSPRVWQKEACVVCTCHFQAHLIFGVMRHYMVLHSDRLWLSHTY
jgi:hypothetical protein